MGRGERYPKQQEVGKKALLILFGRCTWVPKQKMVVGGADWLMKYRRVALIGRAVTWLTIIRALVTITGDHSNHDLRST